MTETPNTDVENNHSRGQRIARLLAVAGLFIGVGAAVYENVNGDHQSPAVVELVTVAGSTTLPPEPAPDSTITTELSDTPAPIVATTSSTTTSTPKVIQSPNNTPASDASEQNTADSESKPASFEHIKKTAELLGKGFIDVYMQGVGIDNSQEIDNKTGNTITKVTSTAYGGSEGYRQSIVSSSADGSIKQVEFRQVYGAHSSPENTEKITFNLDESSATAHREVFGTAQIVTEELLLYLDQTAVGQIAGGPPLEPPFAANNN